VPVIVVEFTPTPTPSPIITPKPTPTPKPTLPPETIQEIIESLPDIPFPRSPILLNYTDEELEELIDIWGYNSPLYGMLQTGDEIPLYIPIVILIGFGCIIVYIISKKYHS
jgi:hypothetical protein